MSSNIAKLMQDQVQFEKQDAWYAKRNNEELKVIKKTELAQRLNKNSHHWKGLNGNSVIMITTIRSVLFSPLHFLCGLLVSRNMRTKIFIPEMPDFTLKTIAADEREARPKIHYVICKDSVDWCNKRAITISEELYFENYLNFITLPYNQWTDYNKSIRPYSRNTMNKIAVIHALCRVTKTPCDVKRIIIRFFEPPFHFKRRFISSIRKWVGHVMSINNTINRISSRVEAMRIAEKMEICGANVFGLNNVSIDKITSSYALEPWIADLNDYINIKTDIIILPDLDTNSCYNVEYSSSDDME